MKILSIGNSFSADAHAYLHDLAEQRGIDLTTVNLAIGGCSLETHFNNVTENKANYLYSLNGGDWAEKLVTVDEIIKAENFDIVTLQQVSGFSGLYDSYQPYLNDLVKYVRQHQPTADLYFHRTWAYEVGSSHGDFPRYDCDQTKMYNEMQNGFLAVNSRLDKMECEISKTNMVIENEIKPRIEALFDGYKQNAEAITNLEEKVK